MRKFALSLVISLVLCIFVIDAKAQIAPKYRLIEEFVTETNYPDTIAVIWIIRTSKDNQRTLCKTSYDLQMIMEIVGEFFHAILWEPCQEPAPDKATPRVKRI
jgi:hypothetical protein